MFDLYKYFTPKYNFPLKLGVGSCVVEGIAKSEYEPQTSAANNELPLSISVLSRLTGLRAIRHRNLCRHIFASRSRNERVYFVVESYPLNFESLTARITSPVGKKWLMVKYKEALDALQYLAKRHNMIHGCLKPFDLMLTSNGTLKLCEFGLFFATRWAYDVQFPLNSIAFSSPELLMCHYRRRIDRGVRCFDESICPVDSRTDLWSLSLIFLGAMHGKREVNPILDLQDADLASAVKCLLGQDLVQRLQELPPIADKDVFEKILRENLQTRPQDRHTLAKSLQLVRAGLNLGCVECKGTRDFFEDSHLNTHNPLLSKEEITELPRFRQQQTRDQVDSPDIEKAVEFINSCRNLDEIFHYWSLSGYTLDDTWASYSTPPRRESCQDGVFHSNHQMPVLTLPHLCCINRNKPGDKQTTEAVRTARTITSEFVWPRDGGNSSLDLAKYNCSIFPLACDRLVRQVARVPVDKLYPTLLNSQEALDALKLQQSNASFYTGTNPYERFTTPLYQLCLDDCSNNKASPAIESQPVSVKEGDLLYQIGRIRLFLALLRGLPLTEVRLRLEARKDIPPFVRAKVWAALMGIHRDFRFRQRYLQRLRLAGTVVDPTAVSVLDAKSINQIEVDLPRCHAYDPLLSCEHGQRKLKRILMTVLVDGQQRNSYTQGLDSLAAVFTRLAYTDEALASAMLDSLIEQRLPSMFTVGGFTTGLNAYFIVIRRLFAFHMPLLATHFHRLRVPLIGLTTGWIYTLFAHSITLDTAEQLWDTILTAPACMSIFIYLAVFKQLQFNVHLEQMELEDICTLLSNFPEIKLDRLRNDALYFACHTPASLVTEPGLLKGPVVIPLGSEARIFSERYISNVDWPLQFDEQDYLEALEKLDLLAKQRGDTVMFSHFLDPPAERDSREERSHSTASQMFDPETCSQNKGFVPFISGKDVLLHFSRPDCLVLDLRPPDEFEIGCLIGSINRPKPDLVALEELIDGQQDQPLGAPCNKRGEELGNEPQPEKNERFLNDLLADPAWVRCRLAREQFSARFSGERQHSPGLLIIMPGSDSDEEGQLARNVAGCLIQRGIDRVCVALGGAAILTLSNEGQHHFLPKHLHPSLF